MSEPDHPRQKSESDESEHPLKAGIEAADEGETASLEDVLSKLD